MAFDKKEVEKVISSVESVTGRPLKYSEKKKVITDMPNNGKGDFVVMKKIGDKRFKISFFSGGKEVKKDVNGNSVGGSFPTVKGMTSHGVKVKALTRIEQPEVVVVPEVAPAPVAPAVDVRQTPADRVIDQDESEGSEVPAVAATGATSAVSPEYEKHLDKVFGAVGN